MKPLLNLFPFKKKKYFFCFVIEDLVFKVLCGHFYRWHNCLFKQKYSAFKNDPVTIITGLRQAG